MDALERIKNLMSERGWTEYKLAKEAELPQSTISTLFSRNNLPSIPTLEAICQGLGITMSQFFAEGELVELTKEQREPGPRHEPGAWFSGYWSFSFISRYMTALQFLTAVWRNI